MSIQTIKSQEEFETNKTILKAHNRLQRLINALDKKKISEENLKPINDYIQTLNDFEGTEKDYKKLLKNTHSKIIKYAKDKLNLTTKHYYLALGMVFGMIVGVVFSQAITNFGLGASGITIGMVLGMAVGAVLDKRALDKGNQLDIEGDF